jgi:hypothetical protein
MLVCVVMAVALVCSWQNVAPVRHATDHLHDHVMLSFDAHTMAPRKSFVFHSNGVGLYQLSEETEPASTTPTTPTTPHTKDRNMGWHLCHYTWTPLTRQLQLVYTTGPLALGPSSDAPAPTPTTTIRFNTTSELPIRDLVGHVAYAKTEHHYLWKVHAQKSGGHGGGSGEGCSSAVPLVGKTVVFAQPANRPHRQLPFESFRIISDSSVLCTHRRTHTNHSHDEHTEVCDHKMVYRPALPASSRWSCAIYVQGRPLASGVPSSWKSATVRICTYRNIAEVMWRDLENVHHRVSDIPLSYEKASERTITF